MTDDLPLACQNRLMREALTVKHKYRDIFLKFADVHQSINLVLSRRSYIFLVVLLYYTVHRRRDISANRGRILKSTAIGQEERLVKLVKTARKTAGTSGYFMVRPCAPHERVMT